MEKLSNSDLRKMLLITILLGSVFGAMYIIIMDSYQFSNPVSLNLEILQLLRFSGGGNMSKAEKTDQTIKTLFSLNITEDISSNEAEKRVVEEKRETKDIKASKGKKVSQSKAQDSSAGTMNKKPDMLQASKSQNTRKKPSQKEKCPFNKTLLGPVHVETTKIDLAKLQKSELGFVKPGGQWAPTDCLPREELAVVIPFRKREEHLGIFLRHMHKFLMSQMLKYRIFVIEQDDDYEFNRGKLMNIGFKEAMKRHPFKCVVFHDIDLIPEDSRNDYGCPSSPRHMSVAIDKFDYELLYEKLFGGVEMFKTEDFDRVNGFSNSFWGWGAEDDNLYFRVTRLLRNISRPAVQVARYKMLRHADMQPYADDQRFEILRMSKNTEYIKNDGLNSLQYKVNRVLELPLFTMIKVNLEKHKDRMLGVKEYF